MIFQRGGFVLGLAMGLLIGLSLALGVALYITKAPIPFINKVPPRTSQQDTAETERNRNWDPNAALAGKPGKTATAVVPAQVAVAVPSAGSGATANPVTNTVTNPPSAATAASAAGAKPPRAPPAVLAGSDPAMYFVQVGAYSQAEEAEQQRAKMALSGYVAKVTEREQAGRVVYRVRVGPIDKREEAEVTQNKLIEAGTDARIVRVER